MGGRPAWSPVAANDEIAFARSGCPQSVSDIWTSDSAGTNQANLTNTPSLSEGAPNWSPNGARLVFAQGDFDPNHGAVGDIAVVNADGSGSPVNLTSDLAPRAYSPAWSPDGQKIAFVVENSGMWVMNADGSGRQQVPLAQAGREPDWRPVDPPPLPPTPSLSVSPNPAQSGQTVNFNAGGSHSNAGGSITNYEWDLDGDPSAFELDTDGGSSTSRSYQTNSTVTLTVRVRVTDTNGTQAVTSVVLTIKPPPGACEERPCGTGPPIPSGASGCQPSVRFSTTRGEVDARAGCWLRQSNGSYKAGGRVRLNGLDLEGKGDVTIDPASKTLKTSAPRNVSTGAITFQGRQIIDAVVYHNGLLNWDLDKRIEFKNAANIVINFLVIPAGTTAFEVASGGGGTVIAYVKLPKPLESYTGEGRFVSATTRA